MTKKQFTGITLGATILLGFVAYANTFAGDWVWDDVSSVLLHETIHEGSIFQLFSEDQHKFGKGQGNFYRPLVAASFLLDFKLSYDPVLDAGLQKGFPDVKPFFFHLTNTLWHVAAAVLLFFLLARLHAPRIVQATVPLLFVLHPMHTEAVAYISGRADMMSATFILAALLCATSDAEGRRKWINVALSGVFFALGLCSKESTTIYPVLLAVMILLRPKPDGTAPSKADWKARSLPLGLAVVLVLGYGALRMTALKFNDGSESGAAGLGQRLVETCQSFALYIKTLFLPTGLHMEQTLAGTPAWIALFGIVFLLACAAAALWAYRSGHPRITLGLAWFLAAWLPISGIFPLNAPLAEHWMYVPMAGFWWAAVELLLLASRRLTVPALVPAAAALLGLIFLYQTVDRNRDWNNNEAIFRSTLEANPDSFRAHANLALTYEFMETNLPGARRHYEQVLAMYAKQKEGTPGAGGLLADEILDRLSLGEILLRQHDYREAYNIFLSLMPLGGQDAYKDKFAQASFGLGQSLLGLGEYGRGNQALRQAVSLDPSLGGRYRDLVRGAPLPDVRL